MAALLVVYVGPLRGSPRALPSRRSSAPGWKINSDQGPYFARDGSSDRCGSPMTLDEAEVVKNTLYIIYTDETGAD